MTTVIENAPAGNFARLASYSSYAAVARELGRERNLCVSPCSVADVRRLEIVAEPFGYDIIFVPEAGRQVTGDVYLSRRGRRESGPLQAS